MKKKYLRITALLLAVLMTAALFSACAKKGTSPADGSGSGSSSNEGRSRPSGSGGSSQGGSGTTADGDFADFVYTAKYQKLKMDDSVDDINRLVYADGHFYTIASIRGEPITEYYDADGNRVMDAEKIENGEYEATFEYDSYEQKLSCMDIDGSNFHTLENFVQTKPPEDSEGGGYIDNMCVTPDGGLWVIETLYIYHYDENDSYVDEENKFVLRRVDATGAEAAVCDLSSIIGEQQYFYINTICCDKDGDLFLTIGDNSIIVIGADGTVSKKIELTNGWVNRLIILKDGSVGAITYSDAKGDMLCAVDKVKGTLGEEHEIPENAWNMINGGGDYDFYYTTGEALYGYQIETETNTTLVNWIDSDINSSDIRDIFPLEDGRILATSFNYDGSSQSVEVITLTKADPATIPEKEILTLACMWLSYDVRAKVIDFNRTSDRYRIRVSDYSKFNTDEDYSAGQTKLATEIISGQVPDILITDGLPIERYAERGLLEDLAPYIDADPEIGPNGLVPAARRALELNGGIYESTPSFYVDTVVGPSRIVGDRLGWTVKALREAMAQMPAGATPFGRNMDQASMMNNLFNMNMGTYVDWSEGKCDFDNEDFIELLEFIKTFPKEINYDDEDMAYVSDIERIRKGEYLCSITTIANFNEIQRYKIMYGGDVTFIGYPTSQGIGSVIRFESGLSMSSTCKNKDAAWSFLRYLFLEENQFSSDSDGYYYGWGFPTNQKAFDKVVQASMKKEYEKDENGNEVEVARYSYWISDDESVPIYATTQEEVDQIMELINNAASAAAYDEKIAEIVTEEAQAFFEGQKSARDVASVIQSRVWIYINE